MFSVQKQWQLALSLVVATAMVVIACNKNFDEPPTFEEPNVNVNCSIRALKSRHVKDGYERIEGDTIISGIVVADDRSGNFYKSLVIQDGSGGITVRLDGIGLFNNYPVGRRIYIKCKGLYLGDYGGLIQLGASVDLSDPSRPSLDPIASSLFDKYVLKGSLGNAVQPRQVTTAQLTTNIYDTLQSTLIQLVGYEFGNADTSKTFGDITLASSALNYTIRGCGGNPIVLRNSSYASFAGLNMPNGNGNITGVFNIFGSTRQIQIRDTADVQFGGARCGSGPATLESISALRARYNGSAVVTVPNGIKITGVVITDYTTSNLVAQNFVLQQGNGLSGITVRLDGSHDFALGDSVDVTVGGGSLSEFAGLLQVNVPSSAVTRISTGKSIAPRVTTIASLLTNFEAWESTLVRINDVGFAPAGTWGSNGGNTTITDASNGTINLFTRSSAAFSTIAKPAGATFVMGVTGQFSNSSGPNFQIQLRNATADLGTPTSGGGGTGGGGGTPASGIALTTSPVTYTFDDVASGLPTGISVRTQSTATALGTEVTPTLTKVAWNNSTGAFKNFASADGLAATSDVAAQDASIDRVIGLRQTGSFGDPGAAFVFQLANTTGRNAVSMGFKLQSLDASTGRSIAFRLEYGLGDSPTSFTQFTPSAGALSIAGTTFGNTAIAASLPAAACNQTQKVWIRLVVLDASTGSGSRPSVGLDDLQFTF